MPKDLQPRVQFKSLRRVLVYVKPYKGRILISVIASLIVASTDAALAKLVQPFVDRLIIAGDKELARLVPFIVIGLATVKGAAMYVQRYFIKTAGQLVLQDMRNTMFSHLMVLPMRFYAKNSIGVLMSRVLNDVNVMQATVSSIIVESVRDSFSLVGLVAIALYTDWKMTLVSLIVLPLIAGPATFIGKKIKNYARRGQQAMGELSKVLEQSFSGVKVIKSFGAEKQEVGNFEKANFSYYSFLRKVYKYDSSSSPMSEIITSFGVAAILWYGLSRAIEGAMTQGELFSVLTAILLMYAPFKRLIKVNNQLQQSVAAAERVFEVLDEPNEIVDRPDALQLGRARGDVHFENVDFTYGEETVLKGFNVKVSAGETIAVVGPSGAGKSTLLGLLSRFYEPTAGHIYLDGHEIRDLSQQSLRRNLALVDQETFLFNGSLRDNICYGRPDATNEEILAAASQAYADKFIETLPDGYNTMVGDRGVRLSGGQRQRIAIARAILADAPVLMLDEATSALDAESEAMVQKALGNLMQGRTTFVIAHRLSTVMSADRILVLDNGRVCESGTHQELLAQGGVYKRLYETQLG